MVHNTLARKEAKELKQIASELIRERKALAGRLAGMRQAAKDLPGELQEDEPGRGPAKGGRMKAEALGICL